MFKILFKQLLSICVLGLFVISCSQQQKEGQPEQNPEQSLLPYSTGKISTLNLYIEDVYRATPIRDSIRLYLEQPYLLVSSPTPSADLSERSFAAFANGYETSSSNLFVVNVSEESDLTVFARDLLGRGKIEEALAGKKMALVRAKDVYAKPQSLFFLLTSDYPNLEDRVEARKLQEYCQSVLDENLNVGNERIASSISSRRDVLLEKMINQKFGVDLYIPNEYEFVDSTDNYIWIIKETPEIYSNLVFYRSDISPQGLGNKVIDVREQLGRKITSTKENSRMVTNVTRPPKPIQKDIEINGKAVYETRGIWGMENDYLGGSFLNYTFANDAGEVIAIDGSVFTIDDEKERRLMRDIDGIFSTIQLSDTGQ